MCHITNDENKQFVLKHGTEVNEREVGLLRPEDSLVAVVKSTNSFLVPTSAQQMNTSYKEGEVRFFIIGTELIKDMVNNLDLLYGQERNFTNLDLPYGTPTEDVSWFACVQETPEKPYEPSESLSEVQSIDYYGDGRPDPCGIN